MLRILLSGCNGKMGHVLARLIGEEEAAMVVAGFDREADPQYPFPVFSDYAQFTGEADVLIDFSHPSCLSGLLNLCTSRRIPAVVATTGLTAAQVESLKAASAKTPIFFSANMSIGINLMIDLLKKAARVLQDEFDIEIVEKHHNQKIDAPSGTALMLADAIAGELDYQAEYVYDRHSVRKKRSPTEIGIHAVRGGTIVGEHEVIFAGNQELIEIKHTATSKEVFAVGAIKAAKFLAVQENGLYDMTDLVHSF